MSFCKFVKRNCVPFDQKTCFLKNCLLPLLKTVWQSQKFGHLIGLNLLRLLRDTPLKKKAREGSIEG